MNKLIKNSFYTTAGLFLSTQSNLISFANDSTIPAFHRTEDTITAGQLEDQSLGSALQTYVNYIMTFLYLIAVFFALWGGFLILTAAGDDEKVTKGKTILIQGGIGLLVIFLAGSIVKWILSILAA